MIFAATLVLALLSATDSFAQFAAKPVSEAGEMQQALQSVGPPAGCKEPLDGYVSGKRSYISFGTVDPSQDFCGAPVAAICNKKTLDSKAMADRQLVQDTLVSCSLRATYDHFHPAGMTFETFSKTPLVSVHPPGERDSFNYYLKMSSCIPGNCPDGNDLRPCMKQKAGSLAAISDSQLYGGLGQSTVTHAKELMKARIDASSLSPAKKAAMKAKIDAVRIMTASTVALRDDPKITKEFYDSCGPYGMKDNAFSDRPNKAIYVCTGFMSAARPGTPVPLNPLGMLLHEMGHQIDSSVGVPAASDPPGDSYYSYRGCLLARHQQWLATDPLSSAPQGADVRVDNHMEEMVADGWASDSIADDLSKASNKLDFLRENFGGMCGDGDDGSHPAYPFRVDVLLRRSPRISKAMGCGAPIPKPGVEAGCSLL